MSKTFRWSNTSVVNFAGDEDPVTKMEIQTRELVLKAMDEGWSGPPFDPLELAERLSIKTVAKGDIPDARLVPKTEHELVLEYNPVRPRGRLRFSIAHEIAHTLFSDCSERIRNRNVPDSTQADNWQLEVLCNIGAAELLMPLGSFTDLSDAELTIENILNIRKTFDVSIEACLIRLIKLSQKSAAAFCASKHADGQYRIDYLIPAIGWNCPITAGQKVPNHSAILDANAIGFTAVGEEEWKAGTHIRIECVGLAPYPGDLSPRVVGLIISPRSTPFDHMDLVEVDGDALSPRGQGAKIIVHVVPNTTRQWGGGGFASVVRRKFPKVWGQYKSETVEIGRTPSLGEIYESRVDDCTQILHMVAQAGIGQSPVPRLRYAALSKCLSQVREKAKTANASVHMPRIGSGHGGADWSVIRELITEELVDKGITTTVYRLPS